jgi:von Willebrand factor type A domain
MRTRLFAVPAALSVAAALLVAPPSSVAAGACGPMDVAFVLDNSVSITDPLAAVRASAATLTGDVAALSGGDYRMGLVTFVNQQVTVRSSLAAGNQNAITSMIGNLYQESGSGQTHASDEALNTAVNTLPARAGQVDGFTVPWRDNAAKVVVLVTNAAPGGFNGVYLEPRDPDNAHLRAVEAVTRGVRINSVYVATASLHSLESQRIMSDYATTTGGTFTTALGNGLDVVDHVRAALASCGQTEVTVRDDPADTGVEPNPAAQLWASPDIEVCPSPTPCTGSGTLPVGSAAYVFVRLNTLGAKPGIGTLELYATAVGGAAFWPTSWSLVGRAVGVTSGTGGGQVMIPWPKVPAPGQFGFLARWVSASDPMTYAEGPDTATNVRNNNNLAWRSVTSVNRKTLVQRYVLRFPFPRSASTNVLLRGARAGTEVDLGPVLAERWQAAGARGTGIERVGPTTIRVVDEKEARLAGLPLNPEEEVTVTVRFPEAAAVTRISQTVEKTGLDLGGTEFRVSAG